MELSLLEKLQANWKEELDKPAETPESTLRALYFAAVGKPLSIQKALTTPLPVLDTKARHKLDILIERRCQGFPLAYLTGYSEFMGIEIQVNTNVLIPRAETEFLGYETLKLIDSMEGVRGRLRIMDICTGSGNLLLAILAHRPRHSGIGSDISSAAIAVARKNTRRLGLANQAEFRKGDLFESLYLKQLVGNIDIITCNPPYISSKKVADSENMTYHHEPRLAFDGGPFGISLVTRLVKEAPEFLKPNSFLICEIGLGQSAVVTHLFRNSNQYSQFQLLKDNSGQERVFKACTK
jgi:release factor glutamine methyltransferase